MRQIIFYLLLSSLFLLACEAEEDITIIEDVIEDVIDDVIEDVIEEEEIPPPLDFAGEYEGTFRLSTSIYDHTYEGNSPPEPQSRGFDIEKRIKITAIEGTVDSFLIEDVLRYSMYHLYADDVFVVDTSYISIVAHVSDGRLRYFEEIELDSGGSDFIYGGISIVGDSLNFHYTWTDYISSDGYDNDCYTGGSIYGFCAFK